MRDETVRWLKRLGFIAPLTLLITACKNGLWIIFAVLIAFALVAAGVWPVPGQPKAAGTGAVTRTADWTYLGAAAHLSGAADTNWRSDVELHNASNEGATVTVQALVHGEDNSSPESTEFFLGPRRSMRLEDVLATHFGDLDKAALRLTTRGGAVMATDRTYNLLDGGNALGLPAGATFGQYISLRDEGSAISHVDEGRLIGLTHDDRARSNLGLVNLSSFEIQVRTELYLADGSELGSISTRLSPYEYRQITRVFERATSDPVNDGYLVVQVLTEGGRVLAQASVVDAVTGDPVFIPAARIAAPVGQEPPAVFVVASAHVAGAAGTNWRTDLEIHNPNDDVVDYTVELLELNSNNSSPRSETGIIAAGQSIRHEDVLIDLFDFEGAAALRIVPNVGPIVVTSRTYNLLEAGNPFGLPAGATFGQFIPGIDHTAAITPDCEGRLIHLSHAPSGDSGFRTNLVMVNGTTDQASLEVELFASDATPLGSITSNLRPFEYRQINNAFDRVTTDAVDDGYAVVHLNEDEGAVFALASVVDNITGDPVGMMATTVRSSSADSVVNTTADVMSVLGGVGLERAITIEDMVDAIQEAGVEDLAELAADAFPPAVVSQNGDVVTADFGDGTQIDGITYVGSTVLDFSGLSVDGSGIYGTIEETHVDYNVNGQSFPFDEVTVELDLDDQPDGTVVGSVAVSAGGNAKSTGATLDGLVGIDTGICLSYPVSGEVTYTAPDGEVATITFGPECDGSFATDVEPAWDWEYRFQSPTTDWAKTHIVEVVNARVQVDVADYWVPELGGTEFHGRDNPGDTPPGVITYHFAFDNPVVAGWLDTDTATFTFEWGRGHNYLLASSDGSSWEVVNEVTPPDNVGDPPRNGHYMGPLPANALGGTELWIRVELYAYGTYPPNGSTLCSQHARFWESGARDTFILQVACAEGGCFE